MKRPSSLITIAVACLAAFLLGTVAVSSVQADAPIDEDLTTLSVEEQEAIKSSKEVAPESIEISKLTEMKDRGDSGPAGQVEKIKETVPQLLTADAALGSIPDESLEKRVAFARTEAKERIVGGVGEIWGEARATVRGEEWTRALIEAAADESYTPYSDNSFTVTKWQGVSVNGDTAEAVFLGHNSYKLPDGWMHDEDDQFQLKLQRTESNDGSKLGSWKLIDVAAISAQDLTEEVR